MPSNAMRVHKHDGQEASFQRPGVAWKLLEMDCLRRYFSGKTRLAFKDPAVLLELAFPVTSQYPHIETEYVNVRDKKLSKIIQIQRRGKTYAPRGTASNIPEVLRAPQQSLGNPSVSSSRNNNKEEEAGTGLFPVCTNKF